MAGGRAVSEERRSVGVAGMLVADALVDAVEVVLAISFAALVFRGYLEDFLAEGIGISLIAAAVTLAILAWRAGNRGVVGSVQDAAAAVLAVVATNTALGSFGSPKPRVPHRRRVDGCHHALDRHQVLVARRVPDGDPRTIRAAGRGGFLGDRVRTLDSLLD